MSRWCATRHVRPGSRAELPALPEGLAATGCRRATWCHCRPAGHVPPGHHATDARVVVTVVGSASPADSREGACTQTSVHVDLGQGPQVGARTAWLSQDRRVTDPLQVAAWRFALDSQPVEQLPPVATDALVLTSAAGKSRNRRDRRRRRTARARRSCFARWTSTRPSSPRPSPTSTGTTARSKPPPATPTRRARTRGAGVRDALRRGRRRVQRPPTPRAAARSPARTVSRPVDLRSLTPDADPTR